MVRPSFVLNNLNTTCQPLEATVSGVTVKFSISAIQKATFSTKTSNKLLLCHHTTARLSFWQHSLVQECMRCHTFSRILDSGYKMMTRNLDHVHTSRKPSRRFEIANEELRLLVSVFSKVNSRA
jgi:hypothetical protein